MKRLAAFLLLCSGYMMGAQQINPNQIQPSSTPGQVLTTVSGTPNKAAWQNPTGGVTSGQGTAPILVNGDSGTPHTGALTVSCPTCGSTNIQLGYTQQGTGQYVIVPFTVAACNAPGGGASSINGSATNWAAGGVSISDGQDGTCTFTNPQLPAGITTGQITAVYPVGFKSMQCGTACPQETAHLGVSGTGISGCSLSRNGSTGGFGTTPVQFGCHLSTSDFTNFSTLTGFAEGATNPFNGGGTLGWSLALEVDYTGSPVSQLSFVNLGPGFGWDASTQTISLLPYAIYPLSIAQLEGFTGQPAGVMNLVTDAVSATTGPCSGSGGGTNLLWCESNGDGTTWTAVPFGGGGGSGSVSGQAAGVVGLGGSATSITSQSHINENTSGTTTVTQPLVVNDGSGNAGAITYTFGTAPGSATGGVKLAGPTSGTAYRIILPGTHPTGSNNLLSCTSADPAICTWAAGGGGSGVSSLNSLTGALSLTSSDSSVTITPSGSTIDLQAVGGGGGGLSGQTNNYLPKATSSTASTTSSIVEDIGTGITIHSTGTDYGASWPEGTGTCAIAAGLDVLCTDSTSHTLSLSTNGGSFSPICTAANGECPTGSGNHVNLCATVTLTNASCSSGLITISSSVNNFTISAIPGTYINLILTLNAQAQISTAEDVDLQFNGDTTSGNYRWAVVYNGGQGQNQSSQTQAHFGALAGTTGSNWTTTTVMTIPHYAGTVLYKSFSSPSTNQSDTQPFAMNFGGGWASTSAITSIKVFTDGGDNFTTGSTLTLYGDN